jgi:hypothetical protein
MATASPRDLSTRQTQPIAAGRGPRINARTLNATQPEALIYFQHHGLSGIRLGLAADFDRPKSAGRGGMT